MKISTEIRSAAALVGEEKAVQYVAEAGFDAWDFTMRDMTHFDNKKKIYLPLHPLGQDDYLSYARKLKQIGLDCGIACNQSHAPFPTARVGMRTYLKRAIECTAEAGGTICIIHPNNDASARENAEMYLDLLPFAKECGVKIAAENMYNFNRAENKPRPAACSTTESFLEHMRAVNDPYFVACLDIGHAEMIGAGSGAVPMIHALKHHLQALHIHDNDRHDDRHQLPFTMNIDFPAVVAALKEINYRGDFTMEADDFVRHHPSGDAFTALCELAATARRLADLYEGY